MNATEISKIEGILASYKLFEEGSSWADRVEFLDGAMAELAEMLDRSERGGGRRMVDIELTMKARVSVEAVRSAWESNDGFVREVLDKASVADFSICAPLGRPEPVGTEVSL